MSANAAAAGNTNPAVNNDIEEEEVIYEDEYVEGDEEEEVIEEEVTDDEAGGAQDTASTVRTVESPAAQRVAQTPRSTPRPGRVKPSEEVKKMGMSTPESKKKSSGAVLSHDRSPFPTMGDWNPTTFSQIDIVFPILTGKNETTNELTRSTKPEARYWKAPVVFKFGNFTSETIRFNNVHIPFHTGKGYGSSYVYLCLPGFAGNAFAEAGKRRAPTKVTENSLVPDEQRWWKIANNVENAFGVISQQTKKFHSKSLETIFDATSAGISCSVILSFKCKAATSEKEALRPTTARTVAVEVVRGFIDEVDINVQMPVRVNREKRKADPVASSSDVATDSLMKRLAELGL